MMHGHEKSDPAIVAKKPTNRAGQPVAEPVERRVGAEGNADQQSTRRAKDRCAATNGTVAYCLIHECCRGCADCLIAMFPLSHLIQQRRTVSDP